LLLKRRSKTEYKRGADGRGKDTKGQSGRKKTMGERRESRNNVRRKGLEV